MPVVCLVRKRDQPSSPSGGAQGAANRGHNHRTLCGEYGEAQFAVGERVEPGHRRLVVEDDGQHPVIQEGNGIRGMRERVEAIGGHFSLERGIAQGRGTRLTIELPLREAAAS